jgi:hypothetical protein
MFATTEKIQKFNPITGPTATVAILTILMLRIILSKQTWSVFRSGGLRGMLTQRREPTYLGKTLRSLCTNCNAASIRSYDASWQHLHASEHGFSVTFPWFSRAKAESFDRC